MVGLAAKLIMELIQVLLVLQLMVDHIAITVMEMVQMDSNLQTSLNSVNKLVVEVGLEAMVVLEETL